MSVAHEYSFGPYTAQDLLALPDEGKRFELVDGWLIELSPSPRHNQVARSLMWILMRAAEEAGIDVCVSDSAEDITTPAGIRRPDVMVLDGEAARHASWAGAPTTALTFCWSSKWSHGGVAASAKIGPGSFTSTRWRALINTGSSISILTSGSRCISWTETFTGWTMRSPRGLF